MVGSVRPLGGQLHQRLQQRTPVVLHLLHPGASIQSSQACLCRLPVREHIGHARRDSQIVLEHPEAIVRAHQVRAADGDPGAIWRGEPAHLDSVLRAPPNDIHGDDAVVDDPGLPVAVFRGGLPIDILQEQIQGLDTLRQPLLELPPVCVRHHPGQAVYGDDPLVGLVVTIDREGDSFVLERACDPLLDAAELLRGELR